MVTVIALATVMATQAMADNVKSLRVYNSRTPLVTGTPVIVPVRGEQAVVEFDILGDDSDYLRYQIVHLDADGRPSRLNESQYVDGFNEGHIEDYAFSQSTTVPYVHYRLAVPGELNPLVSGNYLVRVYDEDDPDTTLLQAVFALSEERVPVTATVTSRTDIDYNRAHQQLTVDADLSDARVDDRFNDVWLTIEQNGRPDTRHTLSKPLMASAGHNIYEHQQPLIFAAGNEYRRFETINNHYPAQRIEAVEYHGPYYHQWVETDLPRNNVQYLYDRTLRGGYLIREYNSDDGNTAAEYVVTHLALEMPPLEGMDIFVDSDAFQRRHDPESRMVYNRATGRYELARLLKQGAYSYQYVAIPTGTDTALTAPVEGDFHQTDNQYDIKVWYRPHGAMADRLIGHTTVFSGQ